MEYLVKKIISEYVDIDGTEITNDMSLRDDLYLIDMEIDDILDELEEQLEIEINDSIDGLSNVGDVVLLVEKLI